MTARPVSLFLRRALLLDGVATGATALLLLFGAGLLEPLLTIPAALLRAAGWILVPFVGLVFWTASRDQVPQGAVWMVILGNAAWVLASIALLAGYWVTPSMLGYIFVIGQAVVVAVFAELQYVGARRLTAA